MTEDLLWTSIAAHRNARFVVFGFRQAVNEARKTFSVSRFLAAADISTNRLV